MLNTENFDWKTFDIAKEDYEENADLYAYVAGKCNESQEYTIHDFNGHYTVRKVNEIERIKYEAMTDDEKKAYDKQKAQDAIDDKRAERENILINVVDPIVTNPLRWSELSEKEQEDYKKYRLYLLDIPQQEDFPNIDILSFEEFKALETEE